jgi:hypothetical protein
MSSSSWRAAAAIGRIAVGAFTMLVSAGHIAAALLTGHAKLLWLVTNFADRPMLFLMMLAAWNLILLSGLSFIVPSLRELRAGAGQPLPQR